MAIDFLRETFRRNGAADAMIWRNEPYSYGFILEAVDRWSRKLEDEGVSGAIVGRALYEGRLDLAQAQALADELSGAS